jgi:hypothetical protein
MMEEMPVETTLYSLSDKAPSPDDRRGGERHLTLFRVGTMRVGDRRELCLIKNISAGGAMLRLYTGGAAIGQDLTVELKCGQPLRGRIAWVREPNVGLEFDSPIDVVAMLTQNEDGPRPRMPRIECTSFVTIREGASLHRGRACDISQGGVKIETPVRFSSHAEVVVTLPDLPPQPGVVRWTDGGYAGVTFNRLLSLPVLIEWLRTQRSETQAA